MMDLNESNRTNYSILLNFSRLLNFLMFSHVVNLEHAQHKLLMHHLQIKFQNYFLFGPLYSNTLK